VSPVAARSYSNLDDEILDEVRRHWDVERMAPTIRELCARLQVPSENTVMLRVRRLCLQGKLQQEPGKARTIRLPRREL
jgi:SOS-response transcriptional repressor LexA